MGDATITDLRNAARTIRKQGRRKLVPHAARICQLIELMEPYSRRHHGLTVAQFYEIRSRRGTGAPAAIGKGREATVTAAAQCRDEIIFSTVNQSKPDYIVFPPPQRYSYAYEWSGAHERRR